MTIDINILQQAKANLRDKGWGQGALVCDNGHVCALGALHLALGADVVVRQDDTDPTISYFDIAYPYGEGPEWPSWSGHGLQGAALDESYAQYEAAVDVLYNTEEHKAFKAAEAVWRNTAAGYEGALDEVVAELTDSQRHSLVDWNDLNAQTIEDVEHVFDLAIENVNKKETVSV